MLLDIAGIMILISQERAPGYNALLTNIHVKIRNGSNQDINALFTYFYHIFTHNSDNTCSNKNRIFEGLLKWHRKSLP